MLVRCGVLGRVAKAGFVDMKEQGLPQIAKEHRVEVVDLERPSGMPIRTTADYVNALRRYHRRAAGGAGGELVDPWAEDWAPTFSIVEEGAMVGAGARVHDSVVLKGARVETGAAVVRSVVCPGAVAGRGVLVAEDLVEGRVMSSRGRQG
jgi:NDP-sugar pyrophosphorylase family protein